MIDFTFTEEQDMFRKAAREFAETQVAPRVAEMEETGEVSDAVVKACLLYTSPSPRDS